MLLRLDVPRRILGDKYPPTLTPDIRFRDKRFVFLVRTILREITVTNRSKRNLQIRLSKQMHTQLVDTTLSGRMRIPWGTFWPCGTCFWSENLFDRFHSYRGNDWFSKWSEGMEKIGDGLGSSPAIFSSVRLVRFPRWCRSSRHSNHLRRQLHENSIV